MVAQSTEINTYDNSKMNALRHGVLSKVTILPFEIEGDYNELLRSLIEEYKPKTSTQEHLVEELAGIIWRKCRLKQAEKYLFNESLAASTNSYNYIAKNALITFDGYNAVHKYDVSEAISKSDEQNKETVEEFNENIEFLKDQLKLVEKSESYKKAVETLDNAILELWEDYVSEYSSRKRDLETVKTFLNKAITESESKIIEIKARPIVKEQAIGLALFPSDKHEKLQRYETHLDRKFEKTLSVLIKLQEIGSGNSPKSEEMVN